MDVRPLKAVRRFESFRAFEIASRRDASHKSGVGDAPGTRLIIWSGRFDVEC